MEEYKNSRVIRCGIACYGMLSPSYKMLYEEKNIIESILFYIKYEEMIVHIQEVSEKAKL